MRSQINNTIHWLLIMLGAAITKCFISQNQVIPSESQSFHGLNHLPHRLVIMIHVDSHEPPQKKQQHFCWWLMFFVSTRHCAVSLLGSPSFSHALRSAAFTAASRPPAMASHCAVPELPRSMRRTFRWTLEHPKSSNCYINCSTISLLY